MARKIESTAAQGLGEALAAAPVAAFVTTPSRLITAANASAHSILGYPSNALPGNPIRSVYAARLDYNEVNSAISAASQSVATVGLPITLRHITGARIDARAQIFPVRDSAGKVQSILEIIAPSQLLPASKQRTNYINDSEIMRFARGAAHDLKNLLAIIAGNVQLAQSERRMNLRRQFLSDATYAGAMAVRLADKMIAYARDQHAAPEVTDVAELFSAQAPIWQAAVGRAITLRYQVAPELSPVLVDRGRLDVALLNLVVNARDAIPDTGRITITADVQNAVNGHQLRADTHDQSFVAISVRDTGTGMTKLVRKRAFDPFFSTKSATQGVGLGLATVNGFARQSKGYATIESQLGRGTTVTICLPPHQEVSNSQGSTKRAGNRR